MPPGKQKIYNTEEEKAEQIKRRKEYNLKILIKPLNIKDITLPAYIEQKIKEDERFKKVKADLDKLFNEDKDLFKNKNNLKQYIKDYSKMIKKNEYKQEIQEIRKKKRELKEQYNLLVEKEKQTRADTKNSYNVDEIKKQLTYFKEQYNKVLDKIWTLHKVEFKAKRKERNDIIHIIKQEQKAKRKEEIEKNKNNDNEG